MVCHAWRELGRASDPRFRVLEQVGRKALGREPGISRWGRKPQGGQACGVALPCPALCVGGGGVLDSGAFAVSGAFSPASLASGASLR